MNARTRWRPVLGRELAERARDQVVRIRELVGGEGIRPEPSLAHGTAGVALFAHYVDRAGVGAHEDGAARILDAACEAADEIASPSLYSGVTGLAWVLEHLSVEDFIDAPAADELDAALATNLEADDGVTFDLFGGAVGIGAYALELRETSARRHLARAVLPHLERRATVTPTGAHIRTTAAMLPAMHRPAFPEGRIDLGLAHGLGGAIGVLAGMAAEPGALPLLESFIATIDHAAVEPGVPLFLGVEPSGFRQPGWCYGQASLAAVLIRCGLAVERPSWVALGRRVLGFARASSWRARGITLCHGSAGLALTYHRLATMLDDGALVTVARDAYEDTIATLEQADDIRATCTDIGFLEGLAGVGLALLAGCTDQEPAWDRCMLLSAPRPPRDDDAPDRATTR